LSNKKIAQITEKYDVFLLIKLCGTQPAMPKSAHFQSGKAICQSISGNPSSLKARRRAARDQVKKLCHEAPTLATQANM
jgi:hypothetical protein